MDKKPRLFKGYNIQSSLYIHACFIQACCKEMNWDESFKVVKEWIDSSDKADVVD